MATRVQDVKKSAEQEDFTTYTILVHGIKGAARSIGADSFATFAEQMEKAGEEKNGPLIREKTSELLNMLGTLMRDIRTALAPSEHQEKTVCLTEEHVLALRNALRDLNMTEVNRLLQEYMQRSLDTRPMNIVVAIDQHVLLFEYDAATRAIDSLAGL